MQYKLFRYELSTTDGRAVHPDRHFRLFDEAKGPDAYGQFAEYRGRKDSVLMHLRNYRRYDFVGLVGRHATKREVTQYDVDEDLTLQIRVDDDDYPHAAFICLPRIGIIACTDSGNFRANAALSRLHQILAYRKQLLFVFDEIKETFDLRKAVKRFRLTEVTFEIHPVNPHTEDLGNRLDESRKIDHIKKLNGTAHGAVSEPLTLDGGFLTAVQQLQKSGHAKVGFKGYTPDLRIEINVPKQSQAQALPDEALATSGENVGGRINIPGKQPYPFPESFVHEIRRVAVSITRAKLENDDDDG
jgi:hypothetical protein